MAGHEVLVLARDDIITLSAMFIDGVDLATIEALAGPGRHAGRDGRACASISAGLGFTTVAATLE